MTDTVRTSGPLFDGRADAEIHRALQAARDDVAERGRQLVVAGFSGSIRDNHGRFLASVTTTGQSRTYSSRSGHRTYTLPVVAERDSEVITTSLATYGPWLEGVGSRNGLTRFKGYHQFRRAAEVLDRTAAVVADHAIAPYVREMNA